MADKSDYEKLSPEELLELAEKDTSSFRFGLAENIFKIAFDKYKELGDDDNAEKMRMEGIAFQLSTHNYPETRFEALWTWTTEDGKENRFPDKDRDFTDESFDYYKKRITETKNPILIARYSDVIWELKREIDYARIAINAYIDTCEIYFINEWDHELSDSLDRGLAISSQVSDKDSVEKCFNAHSLFLDKLILVERYRWLIEIIGSILRQHKKIEVIPFAKILDACDKAIAFHEKNVIDSYSIQRSFYRIKGEVHRIEKDDEAGLAIRVRIAETYIEEAEWKKINYPNGYGVSASFYSQAMQAFLDIGGYSEKVDELKLKIKEANDKAAELEYKSIEVDTKIDTKEINAYLDLCKSKSVIEIIQLISDDAGYILTINEAKRRAEENAKEFVLQHLLQKVIIKDGIPVESVSGEEESLEYDINKNIQLHYKFVANIVLPNIFEVIKDKDSNYEDVFAKHLSSAGFISEDRIEIIKSGVASFINDDYISCIHVLTFQIEGLLRDLLSQAGVPTFSGNKDAMQNIMFAKIIEVIGSIKGFELSLLRFIEVFLVEKTGDNLRNELAHSLAKVTDFTKEKCLLLMLIIIKLSRFRIVRIDQDGE